MFLVATVFLLVLGLSFAVVMLLTRPSTAERVIEGRIAKLSSPAGSEQAPPEELVQIIKQRRLSAVPWLDALLQSLRLAQRIDLLIAQAESSWSVGGVLGSCALLGILGGAAGYYEIANFACALLPGVALAASPLLLLRWQRSRRMKAFNRQLPDAID